MPFYVDTSAFVKLVVTEDFSAAMRRWAEENEDALFSSDLMVAEALRAGRRHSTEALAQVRQRLATITVVSLTSELCERSATLDPAILCTLDALHLAAALAASSELDGIVTYDARLGEAARLHGVLVVAPGSARVRHR